MDPAQGSTGSTGIGQSDKSKSNHHPAVVLPPITPAITSSALMVQLSWLTSTNAYSVGVASQIIMLNITPIAKGMEAKANAVVF
ncbi:hypothetical protein BCIN_05g08260 [Botrytis cinerea B05.10]|uniref:Uncharacterized protein n=1 Tax=Botryotinia fuckeliana (strain B05.10) TaxID=332648 RepID=A0A384JJA3_BOTFB|nr:hypothetical protein BCIN_05g08260 [Botrytis cinerea B05.10]ATZ50477.1 hypothetical protein BCIN_05g08260 [Botrytis cinerea B05.10]